jgi:hypothetical protein
MLDIHLKIVGVLMFGLVVINVFAPARFGWRKEMAKVSLLTRQVFFVHCFFIALLVGMWGVLCLFFTSTLLEPTSLAALVLAGLTVFWGIRLFMQLFVYDKRLWRGHRFNTVMHVVLSAVWLYFTAVYGVAFWLQLNA